MVLEQEKLNVTGKKDSNLFEWRGQFTPEFIKYLFDVYGSDGMTVADPFCGSGTVLVEAARKGYRAYGYDINPAAYLMSCFYTLSNLSGTAVNFNFQQASAFFDVCIFDGGVVGFGDYNNQDNRNKIANELKRILTKEKILPFHYIIVATLFKLEKTRKKKAIGILVHDIIEDLKTSIRQIPKESDITVYRKDSRNIKNDLLGKVDLIITSPPYINVFNYHQNYRELMEALGYNILPIAEGEFGSNRKNRSNRFKTVVQYTLDMGCTINCMLHSLKVGGRMILVVGRESTVNGVPFYNSKIILECLEQHKSDVQIENVFTREFKNRYGEVIKEDIIVAKRIGLFADVPLSEYRKIAVKNLSEALFKENLDSRQASMINEVIQNSENIENSKLID